MRWATAKEKEKYLAPRQSHKTHLSPHRPRPFWKKLNGNVGKIALSHTSYQLTEDKQTTSHSGWIKITAVCKDLFIVKSPLGQHCYLEP